MHLFINITWYSTRSKMNTVRKSSVLQENNRCGTWQRFLRNFIQRYFRLTIFFASLKVLITRTPNSTSTFQPTHHRGFEALVPPPVAWITVLVVQIPSSSSICSRKFSLTKSESPTMSFLAPCTFTQYCDFMITNIIMINIYLPHLSALWRQCLLVVPSLVPSVFSNQRIVDHERLSEWMSDWITKQCLMPGAIRVMDSAARLPSFEFHFCHLRHEHIFPIYKIGEMIILTLWECYEV